MAHRLHHIHIKSKDPRSSALWWADMFGATVLPEIEFGSMLFTPVKLGDVQLSITTPAPGDDDEIADPQPLPHYGLEHVGILTDDLDADLARFASQGLEIYERRPGAGGFDIAFVAAPDGVHRIAPGAAMTIGSRRGM